MSMSQRERMILKRIEDELTRQDPQLSARLAGFGQSQRQWPRWAGWAALLAFALGIALLIFGSAAAALPVAGIGVAVVVATSSWILILVARLLSRRRTG
jgi:hypothetical protein